MRHETIPSFIFFFPAAALFALLLVPLKAAQFSGIITAWPGLAPDWHGHEMVFGYAYAVIGGYLISRPGLRHVAPAFLAWLAGRFVALVVAWPPLVEAVIALAFPVGLFAIAGWPFLKAVKRGRNMAFAPIILGFTVAELLYQLGAVGLMPEGQVRGLNLGIGLVVMLLFVMGGRIIAAASSGAHQARGVKLHGFAQPRLERVGLGCLAAMAVVDAVWTAPLISAALAIAGGIVALIRLAGWRVWRIATFAEVSCLHLGYSLLAIGLIIRGVRGLIPPAAIASPFEAWHVALVGGLGILSLSMMVRVALQRTRRPVVIPPTVIGAIGFLILAAAGRAFAMIPAIRMDSLTLAVLSWSAAYILLLVFLARFAVERRS